MTLIKSISGIRGTLGGREGQNLTPVDIVKFSAAFGYWVIQRNHGQKVKMVIGRDARPIPAEVPAAPSDVEHQLFRRRKGRLLQVAERGQGVGGRGGGGGLLRGCGRGRSGLGLGLALRVCGEGGRARAEDQGEGQVGA